LAVVTDMASQVGLELALRAAPAEPTPELRAHLRLPLTSRLRLALGEPASPFSRAVSPAWVALLRLARLGTVVIHPPVATGIWIPGPPHRYVSVTVHQPRGPLPTSDAVDLLASTAPCMPSLVPVTMSGPARVWVLPPEELLLAEAGQLRQAGLLLHDQVCRDDGGRRAPAHRNPDEWQEAGRLLRTKGTEQLTQPMPELGRAWRLDAPVSLAQVVRHPR
jgi:hypothetical protein